MLKNINNRRPDRQLERNLIFLAYAIMFMSLSLFALFIYPQYSLYIVISAVVWNIMCIFGTIRILKVSESAIGFGTLAAEILEDKSKYYRVDNAKGEAILLNKPAREYFKDMPILTFLEKNVIDSAANKLDLQKLHSAVSKLQQTTVTLSVNPDKNSVFVAEEWLKVTVKPISLAKTEIFEDKFSLSKINQDIYIFWSVENITAYKNMDQIFKNEMSSLHNFLDFLPVGLYTCDNTGKIEYINNLLAEKLNTDKNDAIGKTIDDFVAFKAELLHGSTGAYRGNMVFKTAQGNAEAFVMQQNVRENNELKTRGVVLWNLPNDKDIKEHLHFLSDKFESLFETTPVGIIFADMQQKIIEVNGYICRILGQSAEQLKDKKISQIFTDDAKNKIKEFAAGIQNGEEEINFESRVKNTSGETNLKISVVPMQLRYSSATAEIAGMILYVEDTTNKRNLEMQVAQAQKMQAFGQLAGGVAHDFNNLLTAIIGYCDLLLQRHGIGDPSFSDLLQLKYNVNRAAGVARQLLAISRKQPLNPKVIDVNEACADNEHLIARLVGEQIKFNRNYAAHTGYIRVDPVQFSQVLINLAINAKDAMNGKGQLTVTTHDERLNEPYQFGDSIIQPGDFVVVGVSDTGCGIPPENINRIFEPFFSTKKNVTGSGTGLGLAVVYSIVHQTEGFVKVQSEVNKGTTFEIYLPAYDTQVVADEENNIPQEEVILDKSGKAAMTTMAAASAVNFDDKLILGLNITEFDSQRTVARNSGEIKILFVEDEDAVRIVGARGLKQKGYDVTDCISAENALEHIENGETFNMMITDMMMPGMSGAELANIMRQKNPETIIILASGYSEEIARKELAGSQDFYFLSKPYSLDDLNKKVKEVLAQHDGK